jgi:hypothetical protein
VNQEELIKQIADRINACQCEVCRPINLKKAELIYTEVLIPAGLGTYEDCHHKAQGCLNECKYGICGYDSKLFQPLPKLEVKP